MTFIFCSMFFFLGYLMHWLLDLAKIGAYFSKIGVILEMESLSLVREVDRRVGERLKELSSRCLVRGETREILKLYKNEDNEEIEAWRKGVMEILSENFPKHVHRQFDHETWDQAMNNVNAYYLLIEARKLSDKETSRKKDGDEI